MYIFTFYSLCSEIAGSIISLITLLDMMHQKCIVYRNTQNKTQSFTMDTRLTVLPIAFTTVNDRVKINCFSFFFFWLFFYLSSSLGLLRPSWQTTDGDILLHKCSKGLLIFVLRARYKDYKQTMLLDRTSAPLLSVDNTGQPHTLCLCNI